MLLKDAQIPIILEIPPGVLFGSTAATSPQLREKPLVGHSASFSLRINGVKTLILVLPRESYVEVESCNYEPSHLYSWTWW
ncbi:hypothetical protein AQUCO_05400032v1 [Aquilegia coerulea]|uniref:Uncharacterized protein n=1 Tax=Aquilegia coerulea TaxID=218851 RepID=A0A2G5CH87_AQUCA|nr:hypothetical protein AQUCO_05400032v1 [Aquilegia coerulea]